MHCHISALSAIALSLAACAAQPRSGSLLDIQQQARRQAWQACAQTQYSVNQHVPLLILAQHCDRVVRRYEASLRRVGVIREVGRSVD